jgi:hypothetical protein
MHAMAYFMWMLLVEYGTAADEVSPCPTMPGYPGTLPPRNLTRAPATRRLYTAQACPSSGRAEEKVGMWE